MSLLAPALVFALAAAAPQLARADGQRSLHEFERQIESDYSSVRSLFPEHFEQLLRARDRVIVLDVRDHDEFDVSHIPGAERVDPDMSADEFRARFGHRIAGKAVVMYCSVGVRSSQLAKRVDSVVRSSRALGVYNLRGGVFAWHNTGRRLNDDGLSTARVHGYSSAWSKYLDFDNYAKIPKSWYLP